MCFKLEFNSVIEQFKRDVVPVLKNIYHPDKIILFGSYAKNCPHEGSDLDVIVVADSFSQIPFASRMTDVLLKIRFLIHVDYICYTPDEFARIKNSSAIIRDALDGPIISL